jgi:hypothetical protein
VSLTSTPGDTAQRRALKGRRKTPLNRTRSLLMPLIRSRANHRLLACFPIPANGDDNRLSVDGPSRITSHLLT